MKLRLHEEALAEFEEAFTWYQNRSGYAVETLRQQLAQAIENLTSAPHRFPSYLHGTRRVVLRPHPYSLVFDIIEPDRVFIVALAHSKRNPDYWKSRLKTH